MKLIAWMFLIWMVQITTTQAASFDCSKASTRVEKLICGDADVSKLDNELAKAYQQGIEYSEDVLNTTMTQREWLKAIRDNCQNVDCLKAAYQSRIRELSTAIVAARQINSIVPLEEDPPNSPEFVIRCDKHNQRLIVADQRFLPTINSLNVRSEVTDVRIDEGALIKGGGTDERPLILPAGSESHQCQIGRASYQVVIEPYIFNANPMGRCGAEMPVISLTVSRNGKPIISGLNFGNCDNQSAIHRIQIGESTGSIRVLALLGYNLPFRVERQFKLATLPEDWGKAIYENLLPSGDADTDLFLAVYKRDVAEMKAALQSGANPNAKDLDGFPPLAYLRNGREVAYRTLKLAEFNKQSEDMAKLLFAAGAKGNFSNIHDVTLLDYLLAQDVPDSVIDMLITNGADVRKGDSLIFAAHGARLNLLKKFIDSGADPNTKGADGSTALWAAASHGFGTYNDWVQPPISEYVKCIRLLLQHGAKVQGAIKDSGGMSRLLVYYNGKDERLKIILAELLPYTPSNEIEYAQKMAEEKSYPISQWIKEQRH
jgi:uncharacterized protein